MRTLKYLLKSCDLYGQPVVFNMNGKETYSSIQGGVISLILIAFTLFVTAYNIIITYSQFLPQLTSESLIRDLGSQHFIDKKLFNYTMAFYEVSQRFQKLDMDIESSFIQEFEDLTPEGYSFTDTEVGKLVKCKDLQDQSPDFGVGNLPYRKAKNLEDSILCLDLSSNITLGGDFLTNYQRNVFFGELTWDICQMPDITQEECTNPKSLEEFSLRNNLHYLFAYHNTYMNLTEYEGYTHYAEYIEQELDLSLNHHIEIVLTNNKVETDRNIIFNFAPYQQGSFTGVEARHYTSAKESDFSKFSLKFEIILNKFQINHLRTYTKFDDVLANIQAVFSIAEIACLFVLGYLNHGTLDKFMANHLYSFEEGARVKKSSSMRIVETKRFQTLRPSTEFAPINDKERSEKSELRIHSYKKDSRRGSEVGELNNPSDASRRKVRHALSSKSIDFLSLELLWYEIFCPKKARHNKSIHKVQVAQVYLEHDLNIFTVLRQLQELETLKRLVLSDSELLALNLVSRRKINENSDKDAIEEELGRAVRLREESDPKYIDEICEAYRDLKDKDSKLLKQIEI